MSFLDKLKMAKSRARRILLIGVIFWIVVEWWIHWVDWPWYVEYPIGGYVTLNLIFQMWAFARRMRVLNSPLIYLSLIQELVDKAAVREVSVIPPAEHPETRPFDFDPRMN